MFPKLVALFYNNRFSFLFGIAGIVVFLIGVFLIIDYQLSLHGSEVEVITPNTKTSKDIVIEISGSVQVPGVYKMPDGSRVSDAFIVSHGPTQDADFAYIEKNINKAALVSDGQKIYIPKQSSVLSASTSVQYQNTSAPPGQSFDGLIDINTATLKELDTLPGIGQIYGQNIIEHRPYSTVDDLLIKAVLSKKLFEKIKPLVRAN